MKWYSEQPKKEIVDDKSIVEFFYEDGKGEFAHGWYFWMIAPGCPIPDTSPCGPYATKAIATSAWKRSNLK